LAKYFKARIVRDQTAFGVVIWDGERDYVNEPPVANIVLAERLGDPLWVVQMSPDKLAQTNCRSRKG
jgi:hypothetical protein